MKKFVKGNLETIVEDNDRRIPEYLANGWKAAPHAEKASDGESATDKALNDVAASEEASKGADKTSKSKTKRGGKAGTTDKKVNDAIDANSTAATESVEVDDGLEKKEGN